RPVDARPRSGAPRTGGVRGNGASRFRATLGDRCRGIRMTSVRAAVMTAPGRLAVARFPLPEPEAGAVILRMLASRVCGTDKHTYRGETLQYAGTPHERQIAYPLICGHENVGTIAAIGGADTILDGEGRELRIGDRVVPAANVTCGRCWYCRTGQPYYQ